MFGSGIVVPRESSRLIQGESGHVTWRSNSPSQAGAVRSTASTLRARSAMLHSKRSATATLSFGCSWITTRVFGGCFRTGASLGRAGVMRLLGGWPVWAASAA